MKIRLVLVAAALAVLAQAALADPGKGRGNGGQSQGQGNGNGQGHANGNGQGNGNGNSQAAAGQGNGSVVIADRDRRAIQDYYRGQYASGHCPPGLAKKNNGCLPPGQAKKLWTMGQPLPGSIPFYPLPGMLLSQLTPPPNGYQYVRVAEDVLMMAVGTRLIVGALADLTAM